MNICDGCRLRGQCWKWCTEHKESHFREAAELFPPEVKMPDMVCGGI